MRHHIVASTWYIGVLWLSACCKVYHSLVSPPNGIIRVCHKCEDGIEIPVPRITIWQYEACRVITKGDPEGRIFLSHPQTKSEYDQEIPKS